MRKLLMTGCVLGMVAVAIGGEPAFDIDAFLKRVEGMRYTSSREAVEKLEKEAADNGKAIEEAVAARLADKALKDEDKFKYVGLLPLAKRESSVPMIIEALEWNMQSRGEKGRLQLIKTFTELLKTEDKESYAAKFMGETVKTGARLPSDISGKFTPDAARFEAAYQRILGNGVRFRIDREGDQDLVYCATLNDVPKLKELRRRALYRQSDECFYDHNALTRAIQWVRVVAPKSGK